MKSKPQSDEPRPQSAGPSYISTNSAFTITGPIIESNHENSYSNSSLIIPQAYPDVGEVSGDEDFGCDNGSFDMHPNVPMPDTEYNDNLTGMIIYCGNTRIIFLTLLYLSDHKYISYISHLLFSHSILVHRVALHHVLVCKGPCDKNQL